MNAERLKLIEDTLDNAVSSASVRAIINELLDAAREGMGLKDRGAFVEKHDWPNCGQVQCEQAHECWRTVNDHARD